MRITNLLLALPLLTVGCSDPQQFRADEVYPAQAAPTLPVETIEKDGITVEVFKRGKGPIIQAGSQVAMYYRGWVRNSPGIFDSRDRPAQPMRITIGSTPLIEGWTEGLKGLNVGSEVRLHIDSAKGYGEAGRQPMIPGDADLVFDVEIGQ